MKKFLSSFDPKFAASLVYMLQASEYDAREYLGWFWRAKDFRTVASRGQLDRTLKARLLLGFTYFAMLSEALALAFALIQAFAQPVWLIAAAILICLSPLISAYSLVAVLWLGRITVQSRRERAAIARARATLGHHPGTRIAIAGSYGKTTFKEILRTILAEAKNVAATPGNMNTPLGISRFITDLKGDEDVLIFELGEYYPGDIASLCELVRPQMGIITGINEAHLSKFKTLERTAAAIFELADYLGELPVYKNGDNPLVRAKIVIDDPLAYTAGGVNGWEVRDVVVAVNSTSFTVQKDEVTLAVQSQLLGRQNIGPLVAAIDIAHNMGLTAKQIISGIASTKPYEHRMQPRRLAGAWVIDDTYNGNSDGVRAGLTWLATIKAERRIYVTPGLVEQGSQTAEVHRGIGAQIAPVADMVVLIKNSVTKYIQEGLADRHYAGELIIVDDPMNFYLNLEHFVAAGDVVLMQNDWTDNYA